MYAVIDLETTGLRSAWHDRVVEIAVVHVDATGEIEQEWSTLVNPGRDLGPQRVHGIAAADARRAPGFDRLAGDLVALLAGRAVVAHNLAFDGPFLAGEFARLGAEVPLDADLGLCTMRLAGSFLPGAGRSLRACCDAAGIDLYHAHRAVDDARAAAGLLGLFIRTAGAPPPWAAAVARLAGTPWPQLHRRGVAPVDRAQPWERPPHFLSRLVDRLPRANRPDVDGYLDVLDRVLVGRYLSTVAADALVAVAEDLGLGRAEVLALHRRYLASLAAAGGRGGELTEVAALLGLPVSAAEAALRDAGDEPGRAPFLLRAGDVVVFTGETARPRDWWEARARAAGLVVADAVSRDTRLVVAADPDTMSGKADRAHGYGIPVIHPAAFDTLLAPLEAAPR